MNPRSSLSLPLFLAATVLLLSGCSRNPDTSTTAKSAPAAPGASVPDMETDLARTLKEQANFYVFKTAADVPANLPWEDGSDLPVFADPNAKKGGTLTYFISDFPRTLRTIGPDATGGIRPYLLDYVEPYLVERHPTITDRGVPGLAVQFAVSLEAKTVHYRLDPRARWSDGRPVTTDDLVFTFYFLRSPHLRQPWYNDFYSKNYRQIIVYDKHTFALVHPEQKPDLATRLGSFAFYPRHGFPDFGADWLDRYQWRPLPKSGAYVIHEKDIEKGRTITLTRVKDWWGADKRFYRGRFNPDRYRLEVIRDPDKAVEAFGRGDVDIMPIGVPKYWYETLPATHPEIAAGRILRYQFYNRVPQPDWGLWINRSKPHLDNLNVRLGLQHAANFDLVCAQYFRGDSVRPQTRSDGYGWRVHPTIGPRAFDPVKARDYFAQAGFTQRGSDGVLTNAAGQRLSFTITTGRQELRDMLPILKQEALKAGLEFNLEVLDRTTGFKKLQEKNHEIGLVALSRSVELYPRYWEIYHGSNAYADAYMKDGKVTPVATGSEPNPKPRQMSVQTNNMTMTFVPELDRLIEAYDRAETMEEIKALAAKIEEVIHADAAWVNGWQTPFYRGAYWRYVKWPEGFNPMLSRNMEEFFVHWIDADEKKAVTEARRSGRTWPAELKVFDQFKEK
jgi:microcin C transport system substrate-binding protein